MEIAAIIFLAGVLVFAAHFFSWLFSFTRIPDVLLLMIVGLVLGPIFGLITPEFFGQAGSLFSFVVLAVLLFESGTEIRLDTIQKAWRGTLSLVIVNFFLTMAAVGGIVWLYADVGVLPSFMLGAIVAGTSSIVVIPIAERLRIKDHSETMLTLESALSDVLSVVITIALLGAYELGEFDVGGVLIDTTVSFVGAAIVGVIGGFIWSLLLNRVRQMQNSIFTTPAFVFLLFGAAEAIGASGPIAALAFGVTMGNIVFLKRSIEQRHQLLQSFIRPVTLSERERAFFSEVVFLLQTFFFVFVGLSIVLTNANALALGAILVLAMIVLRLLVVRIAVPEKTVPLRDRAFMASIVPKGLAAAVLATLIVQRGVPLGNFMQDVSYAVILFSVAGTSVLVFLVSQTGFGKLYQRILREQEDEGRTPEGEPTRPSFSSHLEE